jgi:phospholipid-translocating ATPase
MKYCTNIIIRVLELHNKTFITFIGFVISVGGWFIWLLALSGLYAKSFGPYIVRDAFIHNFGHRLQWWTIVLLELFTLVVMELVVQAVRRVYWPTDQDLMQRIERDNQVHGLFDNHVEDVEAKKEGAEAKEERGRQELEESVQESRRHPRASHDGFRSRFAPTEEERDNPEMVGRAY